MLRRYHYICCCCVNSCVMIVVMSLTSHYPPMILTAVVAQHIQLRRDVHTSHDTVSRSDMSLILMHELLYIALGHAVLTSVMLSSPSNNIHNPYTKKEIKPFSCRISSRFLKIVNTYAIIFCHLYVCHFLSPVSSINYWRNCAEGV